MADLTRRSVLAAADDLFRTRGWSGTSMREIAARAGVAVETVYAAAGSKRTLLLRVIDVAVVGDDDPVPLAERPEFAALGVGSRSDRVAAAAHLLSALNARTAALNRALEHAAPGDRALAEALDAGRARQRASHRGGLALVLGRQPDADLVESIWALCHGEVYLLLVESAGWTDEQYEHWLVDVLTRQLTPLPTKETL
jgi:AcrR family transcriptional regulator